MKDHIRLDFVIRVDCLQVIHGWTGFYQSNDAHIQKYITHNEFMSLSLPTPLRKLEDNT